MYVDPQNDNVVFAECACATHWMRVEYEPNWRSEPPQWRVPFALRIVGHEHMSLRQAIREAWQMLRHRAPFADWFELGEGEAAALLAWMQAKLTQ